jgi:hypothetical protein
MLKKPQKRSKSLDPIDPGRGMVDGVPHSLSDFCLFTYELPEHPVVITLTR